MEDRENESRGARKAATQAMVVDAAAAPLGRRDIAGLVGALAGLAATACLSNADGSESVENLASIAQAATGTSLRWVDTVLGAVPTDPSTPRTGDLATKNSSNLGGAVMVFAKGCVKAGDGGGGLFYWDGSSTEVDDGGTIIEPSVAGGGRWKRVFTGALNIMWFGARGDGQAAVGTTGDQVAIGKALAAASTAGRPLSGAGRRYGVSGGNSPNGGASRNIVLPANIQLQDATFKQLAPNADGDVRTLTSNGGDNIKLARVKVDRNGNGGNGDSQFSDAGIYISGGAGHHFEDIEVWGDDRGSGFVVRGASYFDVVRLHVRDIKYQGAIGLVVQGFWFDNCHDFRVIAPKVHDLRNDFGTTVGTRNAFGGCSNFSLIDAEVWNVEQGVVLGGSLGNTNFRVLGGSARDCFAVGFKFEGTARAGVVTGATTERCGKYGFVVSGPSDSGLPVKAGEITFVDCLALDTGSNSMFAGALQPAGFAVESGSADQAISPLGIQFVNCTALDRQEPTQANPSATKTMKYGFVNQAPAPAFLPDQSPPELRPYVGRYNECINCVSIGHIASASPTKGMHRAFCQVKLTVPQPITAVNSGQWVPVNWNGEDHDEGAMHASGADKYIYALQPGLYEVIVSLEFAFNATGGRGLRLLKNDSPIYGTVVRRPPSTSGGDETRIVLTWQVLCAAGDKLSVDAFQQSGGELALTTNSRMIVTKIHNTGLEAP